MARILHHNPRLEDCNMQVSAALTVKSIANMLIYLETVG